MIIGIPKEVKDHEYRVALTPGGADSLTREGHQVLVQIGAGAGSGFSDEEYAHGGAQLVKEPKDIFAAADMIVKVKEPLEPEYSLLRPGLILFTFLHLAAVPRLARELLERQVAAIAYETVQPAEGNLPLLTPMSEVAGRLSIQVGAHYLEKPQGGGVLLAGIPGVPSSNVVILGAGVVGSNAAYIALGMGAHVTLLDKNLDRLRYLSQFLSGNLETVASTPDAVADAVAEANLVVGAVLVPGGKAPQIVTREMIGAMRPGAVIVDVAVDQGGCIETTQATTHSDPVYEVDGVIHYCVTNMPAIVPRTSTQGLCNASLPYILKIASTGVVQAIQQDTSLAMGLNTFDGHITNSALGEALGIATPSLEQVLQGEQLAGLSRKSLLRQQLSMSEGSHGDSA